MLNSLPKSALAPLLIVWLGATSKTIIIAGMSVAIFGSILNLYTAFINVDQEKIKLIYTLHGNRRHALTKVVLPSSVPAIISNMKVNIGLCLVGVIIGEFLAAKSGLGYLIIYSSQVFKMDWLLMSIILLCIMAMGLRACFSCGKGFIPFPSKSLFYCVTNPKQRSDEAMAVFRVERNTGYTVMSNHHLRNKELSLKAKGLLSQMLSLSASCRIV